MVEKQPSVIYPLHFMIVRREGTKWIFTGGGKVILNPFNLPVLLDVEDRLEGFGLTMPKAAIELFRVNGGKPGYYLINLRKKTYHYCGETRSSINDKLIELGVLVRERE
jgi:hypothetical protein